MKKQLLFFATYLCISLTLSAQTISFTSPTLTTVEAGTTITVDYQYTIPADGYIYCAIELLWDWSWNATIASNELNPAPAGTDVTGSFDLMIPSDTQPAAALASPLNYKIKIELSDGAFNWQAGAYPSTEINITAPSLGIDDIIEPSLSIYPNPVSDILMIKNVKSSDYKSYSITDILGKTVYSVSNNETINSIDVSNLSKGLYFLHVGDLSPVKFIKK